MSQKIFSSVLSVLSCLLIILLSSYNVHIDGHIHQLAERVQFKLNNLHDPETESLKIKKFEILLSDEGFLRYRRTYTSGKQEYYSFNLLRFSYMNYLGDTNSGQLSIHTQDDDVIVQTYNDRNGNVDSMATRFNLSMHAVEAEDLSALQADFFEMKRLLQEN